MSSIYRKGRDGYYYYQAYIYNPESKKKNKRVFHALGTKDLSEAKRNQEELDLRYSYSNKTVDKARKRVFFSNPNFIKISTIIFSTLFLFIIFFKYKGYVLNYNLPSSKPKVLFLSDYKNESPMEIKKPAKMFDQDIIQNTFSPKEGIKIDEKNNDIITIPDYVIENIEKNTGFFDQGKIYATVSHNTSEAGLKFVCKSIKQRFKEFDNLVICVYKNDEIGKNLAKGDIEFSSIRDQKKSWLALYTYNSVEGEYFDPNPNEYLGNY